MGAGVVEARLSVGIGIGGSDEALEGSAVTGAAGGTCDVGREVWTPDVGLDPKALLNLARALVIVPSPALLPLTPWSTTFSFVVVVSFSSLNLLSASRRSSAVAWRIRPTFKVFRIRERRLRREVSAGALERVAGPATTAMLSSASSSSGSSASGVVGWRSTRLREELGDESMLGMRR